MLSFKQLSEKKKTPCKINPKLEDIKEKHDGKPCPVTGEAECKCDEKKKCTSCKGTGKVDGKECSHCGGTGYHSTKEKTPAQRSVEGKANSMGEQAYVSQEEVSEESTEEVAETETSLLTFGQFNEDRAADAKKSLDAVKKRQDVLDAHEKKTGKKLDITKTPEHKAHKKNFPGAKRTGKKVKGAKETPAETQDRRIRQASTRIATKGYTSKEKKEVKAMAKHASRFD